MKDPRVVEIEFLSHLDQTSDHGAGPWDYEKRLGVSRQSFLDMALDLFRDGCLEGVSSILPPPDGYEKAEAGFHEWGMDQRLYSVKNLLRYTGFAAYLNHRGRVRLWRLRDEVQKARTKEKFGILWDRRHWDADALIQLAMKDQTKSSAVLFMDLNNFKPVNDIYGHAVGDQVMQIYFQTVLKLVGTDGDAYGVSTAAERGSTPPAIMAASLARCARFAPCPAPSPPMRERRQREAGASGEMGSAAATSAAGRVVPIWSLKRCDSWDSCAGCAAACAQCAVSSALCRCTQVVHPPPYSGYILHSSATARR
jgi:Diguanylate cyclase, GGDEF domain